MSDSERPVVVSLPVWMMGDDLAPGSEELPCDTCSTLVAISPASMAVVVTGARVRCMSCARPLLADPEQTFAAAPGTLEEVELVAGPEGLRQVESFFEHLRKRSRRR